MHPAKRQRAGVAGRRVDSRCATAASNPEDPAFFRDYVGERRPGQSTGRFEQPAELTLPVCLGEEAHSRFHLKVILRLAGFGANGDQRGIDLGMDDPRFAGSAQRQLRARFERPHKRDGRELGSERRMASRGRPRRA